MLPGSYLIIGVSVLFLVGVIVTYTLSGSMGHTEFLWCFISHTGNFPVESCIFSAVFNLCSALYILIVIIQYNRIYNIIESSELSLPVHKRMKRLNLISLIVGLFGSVGLSTTGCFQQRNVHFMHMTGVVSCAGGTNSFLILQTYFCFTLTPGMTKTSLKFLRLVIVILCSSAVAVAAGMVLHHFVNHPKWFGRVRATAGARTDLSKVGVVIEWFLFFLIQLFVYSLYPDFQKVGLEKDQIIFLE